MIMGVGKTQEQFLKEAYALHGDQYDFSKSVYEALLRYQIEITD